jgi:hypothetical protein
LPVAKSGHDRLEKPVAKSPRCGIFSPEPIL